MKEIFLILICFYFLGCSLRHVSEIKRIQAAGANAGEQHRYVDEQNKKFEKLLAVIQSNQMSAYTTQQDFLKAFGAPIFEEKIDNKEDAELWLYRYCEKMRGSEKVYLYFDTSGKLLRWEHLPVEAQ